jgi:hypothetical protein
VLTILQALPQWKALALMRHPVALSMADCAAVPEVVAGTKAKVSSQDVCGWIRDHDCYGEEQGGDEVAAGTRRGVWVCNVWP